MASQTSSRNQRSWVTTSSAPAPRRQRVFKCSASQVMARTSRWLVGSSSMSTSQSPMSSRARSTRRRWPPERVPTVAFQSTSSSSPAIMARTRGSPAHSYSGIVPHHGPLHGVRVAQIVALAEYAHRNAAGADDTAVVHFHIAREHSQKRGFPIAVLAHDADASPLVHPEGQPLEHRLRGEFHAHFFTTEKKRHQGRLSLPFVSEQIIR